VAALVPDGRKGESILGVPVLGGLSSIPAALDASGAATIVLTDSGGIQEETTALGIPCLTLRENTERPITIGEGTNTLVARDRDTILRAVDDILATGGKRGRVPEGWDGHAAERIATDLAAWLASRRATTVAVEAA
jgi:UDP-N-acetylglucosamine 2-epimerase (non-hydrolysing)